MRVNLSKGLQLSHSHGNGQQRSRDLQHQTTALLVNPLRASVGVTSATGGGPNLHMATATECYRCGGKHKQSECKFKEETFRFCHKKGHIAHVCHTRLKQQQQQQQSLKRHSAERRKGHASVRQQDARQVTLVDSSKDPEDPAPVYATFTLSCNQTGAPLTVVPILNNMAVSMEIDTGALVSIMSEET